MLCKKISLVESKRVRFNPDITGDDCSCSNKYEKLFLNLCDQDQDSDTERSIFADMGMSDGFHRFDCELYSWSSISKEDYKMFTTVDYVQLGINDKFWILPKYAFEAIHSCAFVPECFNEYSFINAYHYEKAFLENRRQLDMVSHNQSGVSCCENSEQMEFDDHDAATFFLDAMAS